MLIVELPFTVQNNFKAINFCSFKEGKKQWSHLLEKSAGDYLLLTFPRKNSIGKEFGRANTASGSTAFYGFRTDK